MVQEVNHIQEAQNRLITQYKEAQTVRNYLSAILTPVNNLEAIFCRLINDRFIDVATNYLLDIIGRLVGQPRTVIATSQIQYFGFEGAEGALPFGSYSNPPLGNTFKSYSDNSEGSTIITNLTDAQYRLYIRARILKNFSSGKRSEIIASINFLFNPDLIVITESDRSYTVNIGKILSETEQALISNTDLIPKPIGIQANYTYFDFANYTTPDNLGSITTPF